MESDEFNTITYFFDDDGEQWMDASDPQGDWGDSVNYPESYFDKWNSNKPYQPSFLFAPISNINKFLIKFLARSTTLPQGARLVMHEDRTQ